VPIYNRVTVYESKFTKAKTTQKKQTKRRNVNCDNELKKFLDSRNGNNPSNIRRKIDISNIERLLNYQKKK